MANYFYTYETSPHGYDPGRNHLRKPKHVLFRLSGRLLCGVKKLGQALWRHKLPALACTSLMIMVFASHQLTNRWNNIVQTVPEGKMHELCLKDTANSALNLIPDAMLFVGKITTNILGQDASQPVRPPGVTPEEEKIVVTNMSPVCEQ